VIDFYSPEIKLDGDTHFQEGRREYDRRRHAFIESFGIKVVRFLNVDIYDNLDGVLEAIVAAIHEGRARTRPREGHQP
jgi:very-short-patch-repair endonuclease